VADVESFHIHVGKGERPRLRGKRENEKKGKERKENKKERSRRSPGLRVEWNESPKGKKESA
jgi:hypothetical protein